METLQIMTCKIYLRDILTHLLGDVTASLLRNRPTGLLRRQFMTGQTGNGLALLNVDALTLGLCLVLALFMLFVSALHGGHLHALLREGKLLTDFLDNLSTFSAGNCLTVRHRNFLRGEIIKSRELR